MSDNGRKPEFTEESKEKIRRVSELLEKLYKKEDELFAKFQEIKK